MTPAEDLRSAAVLLRQRATDATRGPWTAEADGLVWPPVLGDPAAGADIVENANYIATMDPIVGLTLADLLNTIAEDMGRAGAVEDRAAGLDGQPLVVWVPGDLGPHEAWTATLRLARSITGGGS